MAVRPDLPALPADLTTTCKDPGVPAIKTVEGAAKAIGDNRLYAACSRRKHRDVQQFYQNVRKRFG